VIKKTRAVAIVSGEPCGKKLGSNGGRLASAPATFAGALCTQLQFPFTPFSDSVRGHGWSAPEIGEESRSVDLAAGGRRRAVAYLRTDPRKFEKN
jgi:hypothetical protein